MGATDDERGLPSAAASTGALGGSPPNVASRRSPPGGRAPWGGPAALTAAALALPGIVPQAVAQSAPERGMIATKYLDYHDWQPGAPRMKVESPSLYVLKPFGDALAVEGSIILDSMTGASPLFHNTLSGASGAGVNDYRKAADVKVTRYLDRWTIGVGAAYSTEHDYRSRAASLDVRWSTEDRNRTLVFGIGGASDRIDSENLVAIGRRRHTVDLLVGVTQVIDAQTIVQSNVTYSSGHGYYSDPYKPLDTRPDHRSVLAWLTRLNRYVPAVDATLRLGYRYLRDSFGSDAHAIDVAWRQSLPRGFAITPSLRYYTQSAADFYFDPPAGAGFRPGEPYTADTRLSAFGALTPGVRLDVPIGDGWSADFKVEFYRQRSGWRLGGGSSPGLETFSARWIQVGVTKTF